VPVHNGTRLIAAALAMICAATAVVIITNARTRAAIPMMAGIRERIRRISRRNQGALVI